VFTSDYETKHIRDIQEQDLVAGSVVLETHIIGKIQGIQFRGKIYKAENEILKKSKKAYLKKFPVAMLMETTLWVVRLTYLKMTDNRLGFGKKIVWDEETRGRKNDGARGRQGDWAKERKNDRTNQLKI